MRLARPSPEWAIVSLLCPFVPLSQKESPLLKPVILSVQDTGVLVLKRCFQVTLRSLYPGTGAFCFGTPLFVKNQRHGQGSP